MDDEYGVFGDVLAAAMIGSWKIEFDEGKPPRMFADATMKHLLGLAPDSRLSPEEVYQAWHERIDSAHLDTIAKGEARLLNGEQAEMQYPWHHPDGRTIIVRCGGVRDHGYKAGVRVIGIHQWVTYMHHFDRELEEQRRKLEDSLALVDGLSREYHTVWIVDGKTHVPTLYRTTGITTAPGTVEYGVRRPNYDESIAWYVANFVDDEDKERVAEASSWEKVVENTPDVGVYSVTYKRHPKPDATDYHQMCFAKAVNSSGDTNYVFAFRDVDAIVREQLAIEERQHEQQRLLEEAQALEKASKAKSFFFSTVSHDIRTPLNAIIGYAELLKLGIADDAERRKAVDSVLMSGHTLLELINDVLDLSKLEAGKMQILPEPVAPARLVEEVADAFRATIGGKPLEIRTEAAPMPWLKLDPQRVRQILFNLVGNAVKFTDEGYVAIRAEYAHGEEGRGTFRFSVEDTGCGISEEDQKRVALPYVQVGIEGSRGRGTGLGLAICKQLVARMGGEIELESALGEGTTFTVVIPDVEEADDARRARLSATQRIRVAVSDKVAVSARVLLVDDVMMNRMVLKTMLKKFGIDSIEMADSGFSALEKLRECGPFDLVLTDMWMPGMDGERLVREIRQNPAWKKLPVYAVTADVEAQKAYVEKGFSGILLKPVTLEKLKEFFEANVQQG